MQFNELHTALLKSIYSSAKVDDNASNVTINKTRYPIDPAHKWLVTDNAAIHDSMYSRSAFEQAMGHKLASRDSVRADIRDWMTNPEAPGIALFSENTGSSKTQTIVDIFDETDTRLIFAGHTKEARDNFVNRCACDVRVLKSTSEIFDECITVSSLAKIQYARDRFYEQRDRLQHFESFFAANSMSSSQHHFDALMDHLSAKGLIRDFERDAIEREYQHANYLLHSRHKLAMTSLKFEFIATYNQSADLMRIPVFFDEPHPAQITDVAGVEVSAYNQSWTATRPNERVNQAALLNYKVCFISAEAFIRHELDANDVDYQSISAPCRLLEQNLEILRVRSTGTGESRDQIAETVRLNRVGAVVIANKTDSTVNYTTARGNNSLRECPETVVIASYPEMRQLSRVMASCHVDEQEAKRIIVSDSINQAVGRNMGYRNNDGANHCLVIMPHTMDIDLDCVTSKVTSTGAWKNTDRANRSRFHFRRLINTLTDFVDYESIVADFINDRLDEPFIEVAEVAEHAGISTKSLGMYLKSLGIDTKRQRKGARTRRVIDTTTV